MNTSHTLSNTKKHALKALLVVVASVTFNPMPSEAGVLREIVEGVVKANKTSPGIKRALQQCFRIGGEARHILEEQLARTIELIHQGNQRLDAAIAAHVDVSIRLEQPDLTPEARESLEQQLREIGDTIYATTLALRIFRQDEERLLAQLNQCLKPGDTTGF